MKYNLHSLLKISRIALRRWYAKDPFKESSVIAYCTIFSLPGLLLLVISVATIFFQRSAITGHVYNQVAPIMGADAAMQIQDMLITTGHSSQTAVAKFIWLITILLGASGVFVQLQATFNNIWEVKTKPRKAILTLIRTRLFSFGMILSIGFLLLISLAITTILSAISNWVINHLAGYMLILFHVFNFIASFSIVMLLFAMLFKFLPDAKIKWKHVWLGSIVTAFLFILGKIAIAFYLSKTNPGSQYGAAGSVILILLWVSYSSMILFYGAEFTRAYADHITGKVAASDVAVKIPLHKN